MHPSKASGQGSTTAAAEPAPRYELAGGGGGRFTMPLLEAPANVSALDLQEAIRNARKFTF